MSSIDRVDAELVKVGLINLESVFSIDVAAITSCADEHVLSRRSRIFPVGVPMAPSKIFAKSTASTVSSWQTFRVTLFETLLPRLPRHIDA